MTADHYRLTKNGFYILGQKNDTGTEKEISVDPDAILLLGTL